MASSEPAKRSASANAGASPGPKAPTPSLPKGGGAIRSIGEKFAANPVTGTGAMTVPIATSPGRGGFGPQLELRYDSGSGNGVFGLGWQFSIPKMQRKTDKGVPTYDNASDVFVLTDAEDLVPITDKNGELLIYSDGPEQVVAYRPRVEGSFARIERRTRDNDRLTYWRVTTRDNVTSIFGRRGCARITHPDHPSLVFAWLLEETRDDKGNVVTYEYATENLDAVASSSFESNRLQGVAKFSNRYLKFVRYGNRTPLAPNDEAPADPASYAFELVFDYGEHDEGAPTPTDTGIWPCRVDPFSTYRSGFEIRTYRLCRRVLVFHRFTELGEDPCLVASTDFTYGDSAHLTKLTKVAHTGYVKNGMGYDAKSHPPVEFGYEPLALNAKVETLDAESLNGIPAGLLTGNAKVLDLDGEGLPGIVLEESGSLLYKRNQGGVFAPPRRLPPRPLAAGSGALLMDIDGDGRKELVELRRPVSGYYERTDDDNWGGHRYFPSQPLDDVQRPDARLIDLTGDGHEDLFILRRDDLLWYPSLGKGGFGPPRRMTRTHDEERGPTVLFADEALSVFLADMTGDGLVDLVRVTNGNVCYWPNRGHGRFGAKVTMENSPRFEEPNLFDPGRLRLADIDGSGTTDIVYLHRDGARIYLNQSGNRLGTPIVMPPFPSAGPGTQVETADLRGHGTACLVWSSALPYHAVHPLRFIDLTGGKKPHLLTSVQNNLGLTTRLEYAASTKFYLEDRAADQPWATKLPFPVHVLTKVETYDAVSKHRFVSTYTYHHGFYDGVEREFRGFGRVDQRDTESFAAYTGSGTFSPPEDPQDPELHVPPVVTKTWFHTGAWVGGKALSQAYAKEYYQGDSVATGQLLPDTILPTGLSAQERREACRALKGQILRQEVYAEDGTPREPHPYTISERSYLIRMDEKVKGSHHGVYFVSSARDH